MKKLTTATKEYIQQRAESLNLEAWALMRSTTKCYMCKKKTDLGGTMVLSKPGELSVPQLSAKWLFHMYDSHGQPPQYTMTLWINNLFKNESEREAYKIAWKVDRQIKGVAG